MKTYEEALSPHIEWIKEQISIANEKGRKEGKENNEIGIKLDDMKNAMGSEFVDRNDNAVYITLRDIFLENGIKIAKRVFGDNIPVIRHKFSGQPPGYRYFFNFKVIEVGDNYVSVELCI